MNLIKKTERPWGRFYIIHDESSYKLKRIEVDKGGRLSYQYHHKRSEVWTIVEGNGLITLEGKKIYCKPGDSLRINKLQKHRIENVEDNKLVFIEVQVGEYFGEDDIIRIEDDYNRVK